MRFKYSLLKVWAKCRWVFQLVWQKYSLGMSVISPKNCDQVRSVEFLSTALLPWYWSNDSPKYMFCMQGANLDWLYLRVDFGWRSADSDYIAFFCGHIYHKECLLDPEAVEAVEASRVRGLKQGGVANKITEAALLKPYLTKGCEICGVLDGGKTRDRGKGVLRIGG